MLRCTRRSGADTPIPGLTLLEKLGAGAFGEVWSCGFEGRDYAVKTVLRKKLTRSDQALIENEVKVWSELDHPHVVRLYQSWSTPTSILFLCERMDESLRDIHRRMARLSSKPQMATIVKHLLAVSEAMIYMHGLQLVHRDLKADNIMVAKETTKVADFGLARYTGASMTAETGSYRWMAPEVIRHEPYGTSCDVYSFAVLAFEMVTLSCPFPQLGPIEVALAVAKEGKRPCLPPMPPLAHALIEDCWRQEATERPTFSEIRERLWFIRARKESFGSLTQLSTLV